MDTAYLQKLPVRGRPESVLFGYAIPYLPDFLTDHTLLGYTDNERVDEVLSRWTQFVLSLRKWKNSAFALRFTAYPDTGSIHCALLCRMPQQAAGQATVEIQAHIAALRVSMTALNRDALHGFLYPFQDATVIVEVRQHEEETVLLSAQGTAYTIHPFWSPSGSWLLPFETLLCQQAPVSVSLYLEPTELSYEENITFLKAAQLAQTLADTHRRVQSEQPTAISRIRDPQAELIGRIYATHTKQLTEPFLIVMQVVSPDPSAAWNIARSFGAAVTTVHNQTFNENDLPTAFDVHVPANEKQASMARRCFTQLQLTLWGTDLATIPGEPTHKERLVYLAGPRGAAAAFRLPVSVRGGVPGISVRQTAPDFEPGPRPQQIALDELHLGSFQRGGAVTIKLKHLARHGLITGFTGAGKTNTVLYLLDQLWTRHRVPFLVIEAAKKEYRSLVDLPAFKGDLLIFTLGDETTSPFRLNPFELLPGVRVEAHLARLQTCFDAALPQFGILPSIVAEALELVYKHKGWKLTDRGGEHTDRLFPTMRDLYATISKIVEGRGYVGEIKHNIQAATEGRIGGLLRGSKGRMFACQRSVPLQALMTRPVVLELNDLNQQDKALTMMFLLMLLREYRELHKGKTLQHVTVVEEAHNVMENVQSVGASEVAADTRAKAVEAFAAMLSEVRAYGEGMLISDQSPEKLAPDAVRNTNLQIAHQLRHRTDREAIAAAMIMDDAQQEYLGKLSVGQAAVFMTDYDRATFMQVPNFVDAHGLGDPPDAVIREHMDEFKKKHVSAYLPFDGCRFCRRQCHYRELLEPYTLDREITERFHTAVRRFNTHSQREYWPENWLGVAESCRQASRRAGKASEVDAAWCYLAHEIDFPFTLHMRREFEEAFEGLPMD